MKALQVIATREFLGSVAVEVWSARDHFVPLTVRIQSKGILDDGEFFSDASELQDVESKRQVERRNTPFLVATWLEGDR